MAFACKILVTFQVEQNFSTKTENNKGEVGEKINSLPNNNENIIKEN